jgi:hypothetical protein
MKTFSRRLTAEGWLTLSALALAAILGLIWTTRPQPTVSNWGVLESTALANPMVSHVGGVTMMTTDAQTDEVLLVLDNRTESLLVYRVQNVTSVELLQRASVSAMFADARTKALGK